MGGGTGLLGVPSGAGEAAGHCQPGALVCHSAQYRMECCSPGPCPEGGAVAGRVLSPAPSSPSLPGSCSELGLQHVGATGPGGGEFPVLLRPRVPPFSDQEPEYPAVEYPALLPLPATSGAPRLASRVSFSRLSGSPGAGILVICPQQACSSAGRQKPADEIGPSV